MEVEMILRISAVVIAAMLLFGNVDISYWKNKFTALFKRKPRPVVDEVEVENDKAFLDIVDLWYSLRNKCSDQELTQAVEKLDEVFPLLNAENEDA